jgi:hypothetical protein
VTNALAAQLHRRVDVGFVEALARDGNKLVYQYGAHEAIGSPEGRADHR